MSKSLSVPVNYLSKKGLKDYADILTTTVADGYADPLRQYIMLTAIKQVAETTLKQIRPYALDEADKFEKWDRSWGGVQFQIRQGPLTLDYSGDDEWKRLSAIKEDLEDKLKKAKADLKEREAKLKGAYLDLKTGELGVDLKYIKSGNPTLAIKFKAE